MAIVDMKRILLAGDKASRDALLLCLQRMGCVEITPFELEEEIALSTQPAQALLDHVEQRLTRVRWAVDRLTRYDKTKSSMFSPKPVATEQQMMPGADEQQRLEALIDALEELERRSGEARGLETRVATQLEQLEPWLALDIPLHEIRDTITSRQYVGALPPAALQSLQAAWEGRPVSIELVGQSRDSALLWAAAHGSVAGDFADSLKESGFTPAQLGDFTGTVKQEYQRLQGERRQAQQQMQEIEASWGAMVTHLPELKVYHDALKVAQERRMAVDRLIHTRDTFLLRGWVPAPVEQKVLAMIRQEFPGVVAETSVPGEDDEPPVLLHNNRLVTPFESVVEGFSMPAPGSIDPTAMMMPFFACFFGMMVSDGGYGLMMVLLIPLLIKLMKPTRGTRKLFLLLAIGGVFTVFWGYMFNTWFGFNPLQNPPLDPIYRPMEVMVLCIALGAVHLVAGMVMGAALHIKRGEYIDVLYDQISWLMLLAGLGFLAVPSLAEIGKWLAVVGAGIIILFAARDKGNNPIKRVLSGLGALYGISSWVSDLLSYMRLFGMGLATGVIGMVINQLIAMIVAAGPIGWIIGAVVFVGGHLFNAGINILGAYVHACRLQYIEFFGKFYEQGGRPFNPLEYTPRYVRISDAQGAESR
jgi:V/A-type H+-transporting ATPase subunit I